MVTSEWLGAGHKAANKAVLNQISQQCEYNLAIINNRPYVGRWDR